MPSVVPLHVIDFDRVAEWMTSKGLGSGPIVNVRIISGGTQNVLVSFCCDSKAYVLRRPPEHKRANSDETMRREARILAALAGSSTPHAALVASCSEIDVIGAAFYLTEFVEGFNPAQGLPEPYRSSPARQREMGLAMVDGMASLGRIDVRKAGLSEVGHGEDWLRRQVGHWRRQLDSYAALPGYPGPVLPHVDDIAQWLEEHRPSSGRTGLIHGDLHFGNVLYRHDSPRLAAIVDWELATIGDPLLDLGHILARWPKEPGDNSYQIPGLPTREEVIARYAANSDRDLSAVTWFRVLACYRLAIIVEGTHARSYGGHASRERGERLHANAVKLLEQAGHLVLDR